MRRGGEIVGVVLLCSFYYFGKFMRAFPERKPRVSVERVNGKWKKIYKNEYVAVFGGNVSSKQKEPFYVFIYITDV